MSKVFNTAGPILKEDHYFIPVTQRIDLGTIRTLVDRKSYFVIHAPRQTGKKTIMLEVVNQLNESGQYRSLYVNVESAQVARENISMAMRMIASSLARMERETLKESFFAQNIDAVLKQSPDNPLEIR